MNHEHEQNRAIVPAAAQIYNDTATPGQASRSALLRKLEHGTVSGLVQRKERDVSSPRRQTLAEQSPDHNASNIHQIDSEDGGTIHALSPREVPVTARQPPRPILRVVRSAHSLHRDHDAKPTLTSDLQRKASSGTQPAISVRPPDDSYEAEADNVADTVMSGGHAPSISSLSRSDSLQASPGDGGLEHDTSAVEQVVGAGGGSPLPGPTLQKMENGFGRDLSHVRVHDGGAARMAADSVNAHAFTTGNDIYFAGYAYAPGTEHGDRLLAHEITHTIQQDGSHGVQRKVIQRDGPGTAAPQPQLQPIASSNIGDLLNQISALYGDILQKQELGINNLERALGTPDTPSVAETVLTTAISLALVGATGAIGSVVARNVQAMVEARVLRDAASTLTGTALEAATTHASNMARDAADAMKDTVKGFLRSASSTGAAGVRGLPAVHQFLQSQRNALINTKVMAQQEFLASRAPAFRTDPQGVHAAGGLFDALVGQLNGAIEEQYLASLREWAVVARENNSRSLGAITNPDVGIFIVQVSMPSPRAPSRVTGARWPGINDASRAVLTQNYANRDLWALAPSMLRIEITTQEWRPFFGSAQFPMSKNRGSDNVEFPRSGDGFYFLHEYSNTRSGQQFDPNSDGGEVRAMAAAHLIYGDIMGHTLGSFGGISD